MRLLNTQSLELSPPYVPSEVPDYAILSHRWNTEEVTFADVINAPISQFQSQTRTKNGFAKVQGACELALKDGYTWIWIDSCCIDKSSSAELQEAINSMWRYYAESNVCYVYLADVPDAEAGWGSMFAESEWFTRGWTLQELIAPVCVEFYARDWAAIGTKFERYEQIADITAIDPSVLVRQEDFDLFSTAERLSWAAHRNVTREEDEAYSLLGLFDVNIPLLYGEGRQKAFVRLQEAVYNSTADHSIFLFRHSLWRDSQPLLADSPTRFCNRTECRSCLSRDFQNSSSNFCYGNIFASKRWSTQAHEPIMTTVTGLRNEMSTMLPLLAYEKVSSKLEFLEKDPSPIMATHVAVLNHTLEKYPEGALCLILYRWPKVDACDRLRVLPAVLPYLGDLASELQQTKLLVCPGPATTKSHNRTDVEFCVDNDLFHVEKWDSGACVHPSVQAGQNSGYIIRIQGPSDLDRAIQVIFWITSFQDPQLLFTIRVMRIRDIWSIKEISERKRASKRMRGAQEPSKTLFLSKVIADRCSIRLKDGKVLSVKLRRLFSSARAPGGEDFVVKSRYQISVHYQ